MQVIYIYCVTNLINGKRYIGQSRYLPQERFKGHCSDSNTRPNRRGLARAIKKYGPESFVVEQLCSVCTQNEANSLEKYLILKFDCISNGYNMLPGGAGARKIGNPHTKSPEWKQKISEIRKQKWADPISRQKMLSGRWGNKSSKFRYLPAKLTPEQRSVKIAESNKKRSKTYQFLSPSGETVTVNHLPDFCLENNLDSTCMCRVANGAYVHHKQWRRAA